MFKKIITALLCTALVVSTAGCGGNDNSKSASAKSQDGGDGAEEKTLELWTCWTVGAVTEQEGKKQIEEFEKNTGIKVNQTNFTYDMLHEKILTAAAGGNVPDLIWGLPEYVGEFYNMGIVADMTEYYESWEDKSALTESVMDAMTIDGKIIGVPYEMTVRAYLTHEDDFKAANVSAPATWDELLTMTDYKTSTGKYPTELACTGVRSAQELIVYLAQYDLEIAAAQKDGKYKNTWNENADELEKATKVFQFYIDMVDKGVVDPNAKNWGWEETDEYFATGLVSSYVSGNWLAEREESNEAMADVGVKAIPYPADGKQATYMECKPLFIMEASQNKDEAFQLAAAFCSKEWQSAAFADRSPRSDVTTDSKWSKDFQALADGGVTFPPVTLSGVTQAMQDALAKVLQEGKTAEEAAAWLSDAVNSSLKDSGELSE